MIKKILIGAMLVSLAACTPSDEAQQKASQGLVISAAQVKAPLIGKTTTAAFFEIANNTKVDDALIGAESPIAERIEIHLTSIDDNGVMKMRRQVSVDMKAGETLAFKPGSYHLMMFGTALSKDQKDAALTLKFKHAPDVTVIAEISDAKVAMDHEGH